MIKPNLKTQGQSLIELLMVIALTSIVLPAIITGFVASRSGRAQYNQRQQALNILQEMQERVYVIREAGWDNFAVDGVYHPIISQNTYIWTNNPLTLNGFIRSATVSTVNRNDNGVIVDSGGNPDPSTKKVTINVSWTDPLSSQIQSTLYMTRYLDNIAYTQTTENDFNSGTKNGVTVTNEQGGEVILGAGGQGLWCQPNLSISALDLPKNGVANAITAIEGRAFAGTGDNSSGISFANINITNSNPPVATVLGTFDGYKTNAVFGELNYAYLSTDNNGKEVEIVNLTTNPYTEAGYFDAPGSGNGKGVFVVGNVGYMTTGNKLYNFDLSSKSGNRPKLDTDGVYVSLFGTAEKIYVVGNYVYVAVGSNALLEMVIVDASDVYNLRVVGWADVNGESGKEVYVNATGTRAYLATGGSSSKPEFFIINTDVKTSGRPNVGTYDANGMSPKGITIVTGNKAILVGNAGEEYQVIDITDETHPTRCGGLQINSGINGVSSVLETDGDAYSYLVTSDATAEFKIIEGGPGGQYATSGEFESSTFDPGTQTTYFNRLSANITRPSQTDIKIQVAVADAISGSCNGVTFSFVGPDKTSGSFFTTLDNTTIVDAIPADDNSSGYENPGRCFRYKVFLNTNDLSQTPVFYDATVNYSP
ncbi:hypothetical protein A3C23_01455 [Candidatus Roizmanbacteria bacterium RIFCSPHIGHO2_02_FULL_37_13b]|uniref:Uncharacterized protein n=1 Tax=Candidatus Roizmanbacteria bacterium RIFCSPLOWO2_02_FULL_36_11 TaxID=1802071 RepID=A0A1F7JIG1_9BACT|nr:MAG: hypothetical protein A3C23_01455 [Candidatus Roizmanbacteria bacterium RIFCSPHIGHO2_02_FULL_37_13b]OGK55404.1 MAG: hypothetical protein A3H78_05925 [Candidatus Roizmanbacteria bacterium RIFCSPLOWO2_02_FULL_36_11]